jgi:hypothetical protein
MSPVITQWTDKYGNTFYFEHLKYMMINNDGPVPLLVIGCRPEHPGNVIRSQQIIGPGVAKEEADLVCRQWAIYVGIYR